MFLSSILAERWDFSESPCQNLRHLHLRMIMLSRPTLCRKKRKHLTNEPVPNTKAKFVTVLFVPQLLYSFCVTGNAIQHRQEQLCTGSGHP
ncbi:uncharacterized protein BT62DRAFT_257243 [Guyanagaster necrorhizus]|uniref:Uncharacterized protein n=1 Tax=Guyanagaster necrorhizus TaxID=856835 RepID=A0A9P7VNW2_9AGAR|nr:uncharacterized protein BT62DRAFT_257243 [Guyanagaster necrorhizus MCA 3950]KAG7444189.1 hypothetical protein BT62DRAFT_257243 [Guyanagaster necrorhizus MCA 3950]